VKPVHRGPWERLTRMSWEEMRTRGRQELSKRWDASLYRLGKRFGGDARLAAPAAAAHFFFEPGELPAVVALYRSRYPEDAEALLAQAECICRHQFDLLGYEKLDYGAEIDWHLDAVRGIHAPRKPWYKIRTLDAREVGDAKVIWELNRHQYLIPLAIAECLTGSGRFAAELMRQWYHWQAENPYPIGINWASSLELAFRSMSWLWASHLLAGSSAVPPRFHSDLLRALALHARHIEKHLSTYHSPNTHLLGEAVGLFFIGTLCPQLPAASRWRQLGWQILLEHAEQKVRADGFYFEQSTYYHVYALDFFLHARILAAANGMAIPVSFDRTLENMLEILCALGRAGAPPRFGDDDGGRVFDPRRNRAEHLLDPLSTGAVLYRRSDFKAVAGELREETFWLLGAPGAARFDEMAATPPGNVSTSFESSGIYVMSGSADSQQQVVVDAGPLGGGTGGHGHADALSLHLNVQGRECLADPGTYLYTESDRDWFRSSAAHNVLQVAGAGHAEPAGRFSWRALPEVRAERWVASRGFDLFVGNHNGYMRLPQPVTHQRWVFYLRDRFLLMRDVLLGRGTQQFDIHWHLAPGGNPQIVNDHTVLAPAPTGGGLALFTTNQHGGTLEIGEGRFSPVYGSSVASAILHFRKEATLPAEFVTMLVPLESLTGELGELQRMSNASQNDPVSSFQYSTARENHLFFFSEGEQPWKLESWLSDARFLYCRLDEKGSLEHLALSGGSAVRRDSQQVLSAKKTIERFEWRHDAHESFVSSSDESALEILPERLPASLPLSSKPRGEAH